MNTQMTTNVYKIQHQEGYEWLAPVDRDDYGDLIFDGKPRAKTWQPIRVRLVTFDRKLLQPCDFLYGGGADLLPMTQPARERVAPHIEKYGEFLPLKSSKGNFCAFHVTHFVDALDERASNILYATDEPGYVLMIHKHVFRPEKLTGDWMFKLPQSDGRGAIYVTDPFVNFIRASGLKGIDFRRVWPHS
jgi:hypothetical protein